MESINDKVTHVKNAKQTRVHKCHWPECSKQVKPALWGCSKHWFMLPGTLRAKIWATYKVGQEETLSPSPEYLAVLQEIAIWMKLNGYTTENLNS